MHRHKAIHDTEHGYQHPIPGAEENPAAHGNIERREVCSCGATRYLNINQWHYETGPWSYENETSN